MVNINSDQTAGISVAAGLGLNPGFSWSEAPIAILKGNMADGVITPMIHTLGPGMDRDNVIRLHPNPDEAISDRFVREEIQALWNDILQHHLIEIVPATLADAQRELAGVADEAREEEYPVPSELAFKNAARLLPEICQLTPRPVAVYPIPNDGIALDISGGHGRSVLMLCESAGSALCMLNLDGEHRRARYDNTRTLPDGFLREALAEMESKPRV